MLPTPSTGQPWQLPPHDVPGDTGRAPQGLKRPDMLTHETCVRERACGLPARVGMLWRRFVSWEGFSMEAAWGNDTSVHRFSQLAKSHNRSHGLQHQQQRFGSTWWQHTAQHSTACWWNDHGQGPWVGSVCVWAHVARYVTLLVGFCIYLLGHNNIRP